MMILVLKLCSVRFQHENAVGLEPSTSDVMGLDVASSCRHDKLLKYAWSKQNVFCFLYIYIKLPLKMNQEFKNILLANVID